MYDSAHTEDNTARTVTADEIIKLAKTAVGGHKRLIYGGRISGRNIVPRSSTCKSLNKTHTNAHY